MDVFTGNIALFSNVAESRNQAKILAVARLEKKAISAGAGAEFQNNRIKYITTEDLHQTYTAILPSCSSRHEVSCVRLELGDS